VISFLTVLHVAYLLVVTEGCSFLGHLLAVVYRYKSSQPDYPNKRKLTFSLAGFGSNTHPKRKRLKQITTSAAACPDQ
jgi:hypothetical protein